MSVLTLLFRVCAVEGPGIDADTHVRAPVLRNGVVHLGADAAGKDKLTGIDADGGLLGVRGRGEAEEDARENHR